MTWQPIEKCPKHTSVFLCSWWKHSPEHSFRYEGYLDWDGRTWRTQNGAPLSPDFTAPTHYQELPDAPERKADIPDIPVDIPALRGGFFTAK